MMKKGKQEQGIGGNRWKERKQCQIRRDKTKHMGEKDGFAGERRTKWLPDEYKVRRKSTEGFTT